MALFNLAGGSSKWWNYGNPQKDGYNPILQGTVVEVDLVPRTDPTTRKPMFFDSGSPKVNIRYHILTKDGDELLWEFKPGSMSRPSAARLALQNALLAAGLGTDVDETLGQRITIVTQDGVYNQAHPRPWSIKIDGPGDQAAVRGGFNKVQEMLAQMMQSAPAPQAPAPMPNPNDPVQAAMLRAKQASEIANQQRLGYQQPQQMQQPQQPQQPYGFYDEDMPF